MNINFTLIAQAVVFALFIWFTARFIWPPIMRAMDDRRKKIADGLAAAEQGNKSLDEAQRKIAHLDAEARGRAQAMIAETERHGQQIIEEARAQAKVEADRLIANARAEAEQAMQRAKEELRDQVAALAVAGAEQILKKEVNAQVHADLLAQLKGKL
ncbi:MAG: F0F1 ATP synthase subunit B [Gemmatimonadota bacterium]